MEPPGKQDITMLRQQLEDRRTALQQACQAQQESIETALREMYQIHIQDLGGSVLSILEKSERELYIEALNKSLYERGIELAREQVEKPKGISDLRQKVYFLHPQGPVLGVEEIQTPIICYPGIFGGSYHISSRRVEERLSLNEFIKRLNDQQLPEVYEKLTAVVKEKGME